MTDADLRADVARLAAEVAALRAELRPRPITSWRGAAAVLAVSEDTITRHRRKVRDATHPWWRDADAVREWWAELHGRPVGPPPTARRAPATKPVRTTALRARDLLRTP